MSIKKQEKPFILVLLVYFLSLQSQRLHTHIIPNCSLLKESYSINIVPYLSCKIEQRRMSMWTWRQRSYISLSHDLNSGHNIYLQVMCIAYLDRLSLEDGMNMTQDFIFISIISEHLYQNFLVCLLKGNFRGTFVAQELPFKKFTSWSLERPLGLKHMIGLQPNPVWSLLLHRVLLHIARSDPWVWFMATEANRKKKFIFCMIPIYI